MSLTTALALSGGILLVPAAAWAKPGSPSKVSAYDELVANLQELADEHKVATENLTHWPKDREVILSFRHRATPCRVYFWNNTENIPMASGGVIAGDSSSFLYFQEAPVSGYVHSGSARPTSLLLHNATLPAPPVAAYTLDPLGYETSDSAILFDPKAYSEINFRAFLSRVDPEDLA